MRHARSHLGHLSRYLPQRPGCNKRLRRLGTTIAWLVGVLVHDTSLWTDDVWVADSTPVECARSREAVQHSDLAGWAEYGYRAGRSRFFWGLRLHLSCTLHGLPVEFALTGAKGRRTPDPARDLRRRPPHGRGPTGRHRVLQAVAAGHRVGGQRHLQRPAQPRTAPRPPPAGVWVRIVQRVLALTAAIWHNDRTGQCQIRRAGARFERERRKSAQQRGTSGQPGPVYDDAMKILAADDLDAVLSLVGRPGGAQERDTALAGSQMTAHQTSTPRRRGSTGRSSTTTAAVAALGGGSVTERSRVFHRGSGADRGHRSGPRPDPAEGGDDSAGR